MWLCRVFSVGSGVGAFDGQSVVHANGDLAGRVGEGSVCDQWDDAEHTDPGSGHQSECGGAEGGVDNAETASVGGGEGAEAVKDNGDDARRDGLHFGRQQSKFNK